MRLKNILLVVSNIEQSKRFYHDFFGLQIVCDFGENVILSEGLVLQEQLIKNDTVAGNASELFFEENDFDAFLHLIEKYPEQVRLIGGVRTTSWGKRAL